MHSQQLMQVTFLMQHLKVTKSNKEFAISQIRFDLLKSLNSYSDLVTTVTTIFKLPSEINPLLLS